MLEQHQFFFKLLKLLEVNMNSNHIGMSPYTFVSLLVWLLQHQLKCLD